MQHTAFVCAPETKEDDSLMRKRSSCSSTPRNQITSRKPERLAALFALFLAFSLLLSACGAGSAQADALKKAAAQPRTQATKEEIPAPEELTIPAGQTIRVGYLAQNETIQFNTYLSAALLKEAEKYQGQVEVEMVDARGIAANQVSQAEDMVTKGVDAMIISAYDQDASAPALDVAVKAGIPVIAVNTVTSNINIATAYVGVDDREAGIKAVQLMSDALGGKGTVNVMKGLLGDPANEKRMLGLDEELGRHPDIKVGSALSADWDRGKAMNLAEDWIIGGEPFDGLIAMNDEMAISASNAFRAAGWDDVLVIGVDAIDEALEMIREGKLYGTVFQDAAAQGRGALNIAVAAVLGEDVHKDYIIPYETVTAENVEQYIGRYS